MLGWQQKHDERPSRIFRHVLSYWFSTEAPTTSLQLVNVLLFRGCRNNGIYGGVKSPEHIRHKPSASARSRSSSFCAGAVLSRVKDAWPIQVVSTAFESRLGIGGTTGEHHGGCAGTRHQLSQRTVQHLQLLS
jgi:hypothetical protein